MIRLRDVTMELDGGGHRVRILDGISLHIPEKQTVAIVGPSGSGKSTLLGLMAGLDHPTSGSIEVRGVELSGLSESALAEFRRAAIGYVFQAFHLIPTLTALDNVAVPLELAGQDRPHARAADLLAAVGLADRRFHYPAQLSGGEQQRVAVARAFACRPPILLADEPTGNLDSATGRQVMDLLHGLHRDAGTTLVLVTHEVALAHEMARIVTMRDGRIDSDRLLSPPHDPVSAEDSAVPAPHTSHPST